MSVSVVCREEIRIPAEGIEEVIVSCRLYPKTDYMSFFEISDDGCEVHIHGTSPVDDAVHDASIILSPEDARKLAQTLLALFPEE